MSDIVRIRRLAFPLQPAAPQPRAVPIPPIFRAVRTLDACAVPACLRRRRDVPAGPRAQRGFSLVEVSIVTAIILLISIASIPAINNYVIENKVPRVGEEMQRFVARLKANAQGAGSTPYAGIDGAGLANAMRNSSVLSVSGQGSAAQVAHGLGGRGSSGSGTVALAPASAADGGSGSAFALTFTDVNDAACPSLASVMQRVSEVISIAGAGGAVVVKDALATPPLPYSAAQAELQCTAGDRNTFVFTVR